MKAKKKVKPEIVLCDDGIGRIRKMEYGGRSWETAANRLAREYVGIVACGHCGHPRIITYLCERCGYE